MSRFALKKVTPLKPLAADTYPQGFSFPTDKYSKIIKPGLREEVVREISHIKEEPAWMLQERLAALQSFEVRPMPNWGADLSGIDFNSIHYYLRPTDKQYADWNEVPADVKETFERLGVPEAERSVLAGIKAQYDSEVVYGSVQKALTKDGVIFLSMDEGLKKYPDLVKEYFGKVIKSGDNKFSALNTATWSGGSFVYVPKNVQVKLPLQTYFRINSPNAGQFERTLIIVDEGASVHYVEGCFVVGTDIQTSDGLVKIEDIETGDKVLTHSGRYRDVYHTQVRSYSGVIYTVKLRGNPALSIKATEEHPFLIVKRKYQNERNKTWEPVWTPIKEVSIKDYACIPIHREEVTNDSVIYKLMKGAGRHLWKIVDFNVPSTPDFFRLYGYYLAEGSISSGHYLNFSFNENKYHS